MADKSIAQLQKEIKDLERKKREKVKREALEEKLKRLKTPSKMGARGRIRRGLGPRISRSLDRASKSIIG